LVVGLLFTSEDGDQSGRDLFGKKTHGVMSGPGDGMGQTQTRNVGHSIRRSDEVALWPKLFGHQGDHCPISASHFDSVTHGAGGAAASMSVGGHDRGAAFGEGIEIVFAGNGTGVALVVMHEVHPRELVGERLFEVLEESH
jgi:hypothetical protein